MKRVTDDEGFVDDGIHPWQERRGWWPRDQDLRDRGWKIHARPNDGPAMWRKGDMIVTHERALELAKRKQAYEGAAI